MASKPYSQAEETPCVLKEPAGAYQAESKFIPASHVMEPLRFTEEDYKAGRVYTEEMGGIVAEWLRPHTTEEINAICDEAEADDEADRLLNCDFVHAEMERLNPWLCK